HLGGRGARAVRAVSTAFDHLDPSAWHVASDAVELSRFGARIVRAVHDEKRDTKLVQAMLIEVLIRSLRDVAPRATASAEDRLPVVLAVFERELSRHAV